MDRIRFLERCQERPLVADGAMGTLLVSRGLPSEHHKGLACLEAPDLVREIHEDYLSAGAAILRTNSFDSNRIRLAAIGRENDIERANRQAVRLVRESLAGEYGLVGGVLGPLGALVRPYGRLTLGDVRALYREQLRFLLEEGIDLVFVEAMPGSLEAVEAVGAARDLAPDIPVVALATFGADGRNRFGEAPAEVFAALAAAGATFVGASCTLGPEETFEILRDSVESIPAPLAILPNAGYPTVVGGRSLFLSSPEYVAAFAEPFVSLGALLLGGCCGTTPEHVRALVAAAARLHPAARPSSPPVLSPLGAAPPATAASPASAPSPLRSRLGRDLVVTCEVEPPRGATAGAALALARIALRAGVDALSVPDSPNARLRMSPVAFAHILERDLGVEAIVHLACRSRNLLGLQSELLGASALGLRTVLALTGDPAASGDYPQATSVRDVDALGLVRIVRGLNAGVDTSRGSIGEPTDFLVGTNVRTASPDPDAERGRLLAKIEAGAGFLLTLPIFDPASALAFLEPERRHGIPVLAAVLPFRNHRQALFFANEIPDYAIPQALLDRMKRAASESPAAEAAEGAAIAVEITRALAPRVDGIHIVPNNRFDAVADIVAAAREARAAVAPAGRNR